MFPERGVAGSTLLLMLILLPPKRSSMIIIMLTVLSMFHIQICSHLVSVPLRSQTVGHDPQRAQRWWSERRPCLGTTRKLNCRLSLGKFLCMRLQVDLRALGGCRAGFLTASRRRKSGLRPCPRRGFVSLQVARPDVQDVRSARGQVGHRWMVSLPREASGSSSAAMPLAARQAGGMRSFCVRLWPWVLRPSGSGAEHGQA